MVDKLFFPRRAIHSFVEAANNRRISPRNVNDILKYKDTGIDVSPIEALLNSKDEFIRMYSAQIVSVMGDTKKVIEAVKVEEEKNVLLDMIKQLMLNENGLEELVYLLDENDDQIIRETAIEMFRRSGRSDCLMSLLFSDDDDVVRRVKKWMKEMDESNG